MQFKQNVTRAKMLGDKDAKGRVWIEAEPEVVSYYNPDGLGGQDYFIFEGVFITEKSKKDETSNKVNNVVPTQAFGDPRIKIVGMT